MFSTADTIVAIATPPGRGGIGVVRLSGPEAHAIARALRERSRTPVSDDQGPRGMLIEEIDGVPPSAHPIAPHLAKAGFITGAMGFQSH